MPPDDQIDLNADLHELSVLLSIAQRLAHFVHGELETAADPTHDAISRLQTRLNEAQVLAADLELQAAGPIAESLEPLPRPHLLN